MTPWAPWSPQNRSKDNSSANLSSDMISSFNLTGSSTNLLANLGMSLKDRESLRIALPLREHVMNPKKTLSFSGKK
jgi:hypothetical protein